MDIIGVIDRDGNSVVEYSYDAWGNFKTLDSNKNEVTVQNHIGIINSFVYKSYSCDKETGVYYLMSRY